jgi:hypothetical protein
MKKAKFDRLRLSKNIEYAKRNDKLDINDPIAVALSKENNLVETDAGYRKGQQPMHPFRPGKEAELYGDDRESPPLVWRQDDRESPPVVWRPQGLLSAPTKPTPGTPMATKKGALSTSGTSPRARPRPLDPNPPWAMLGDAPLPPTSPRDRGKASGAPRPGFAAENFPSRSELREMLGANKTGLAGRIPKVIDKVITDAGTLAGWAGQGLYKAAEGAVGVADAIGIPDTGRSAKSRANDLLDMAMMGSTPGMNFGRLGPLAVNATPTGILAGQAVRAGGRATAPYAIKTAKVAKELLADKRGSVPLPGKKPAPAPQAPAPKGALNTVFDGAANYAEALKIAKAGGHLRQDSTGAYIGAPKDVPGNGSMNVDSPETLEGFRSNMDNKMSNWEHGADWYDITRDAISNVSDSPAQAKLLSRGGAVYSAQATPLDETTAFLRQHNAKMVTGEDFKPKMPLQMTTTAKGYSRNPDGSYTMQGEKINLGNKTNAYSDGKDPTIDRTGPAGIRAANDLWHGRATGYSEVDDAGRQVNFNRAFTDPEHGFLTGENLLATDRAIQAKNLEPGSQPEALQAKLWVRERYDSYILAGKSHEDALREAMLSVSDAIDARTASMTYEFTPGGGLGELEGLAGNGALNSKFAERMGQATGPKDDVFSALQMYQKPITNTEGRWIDPTTGNLELNPGFSAQPLVGVKAGGTGMDDPSRTAMEAAAHLNALEGAQHATGGNMFIPKMSSMKVGQINGLAVDGDGPALQQAEAALRSNGLDVVDVGGSLRATSFGGMAPKDIQKGALSALSGMPGVKARPGYLDGILQKGLLTPDVGTGASTKALLDHLDQANIPDFDARLSASGYPEGVRRRTEAREAFSKEHPEAGSLRPDMQKLRGILSQDGIRGLRAYVTKNGYAGLPAVAGALLTGGMTRGSLSEGQE